MENEIAEFIRNNKVASVCCVDEGMPYCFNCYYAFAENEGLLIYKSSLGTRHEKIIDSSPQVAGTIIPEQIELATLRGIQFEGTVLREDFQLSMKTSAIYYAAFPFAFAIPGKIYAIQLNSIKLTDNSIRFGFKQHWEREQ